MAGRSPCVGGLPNGCPYVVVLWAPGWDVGNLAISGAVFGNLEMVMPVDTSTGTADLSHLHNEFGGNAVMHHSVRAHISAVATLRRFNPTLRASEDKVSERLDEVGREDVRTGRLDRHGGIRATAS